MNAVETSHAYQVIELDAPEAVAAAFAETRPLPFNPQLYDRNDVRMEMEMMSGISRNAAGSAGGGNQLATGQAIANEQMGVQVDVRRALLDELIFDVLYDVAYMAIQVFPEENWKAICGQGAYIPLLEREQFLQWLRETLWFVRIIFPLLLVGVFLVGVIGKVLPEEWVREWLGGNSLTAAFLSTLLGSVSYFATMTEAPFVDTLMGLGMGKGPALALLLTGPGLSLPNWLAIARVFGARKALVYVPTIMVTGTLMGWVFGNFIL